MRTTAKIFGRENETLAFEEWKNSICYTEIDDEYIVIDEIKYEYRTEWSDLAKVMTIYLEPKQLLGSNETAIMTALLQLMNDSLFNTIEIEGQLYIKFHSGKLLAIQEDMKQVLIDQLTRGK